MYYRYIVLKHNRKLPEHSSKLEKSEMFLFCAFLKDRNTSELNSPFMFASRELEKPIYINGRHSVSHLTTSNCSPVRLAGLPP